MIVYSTDPTEGYLSEKGLMALRSSFAKDIFAQDLLCEYKKQTEHRDALKVQSREVLAELIAKINGGTYDNPQVEDLLQALAKRLAVTNGKKQYGYLRKDIKEIINSIVDELGKDERIAALYDLWYESNAFVSVNKSMVTNQAVAKTGTLLLQGRKVVDISKPLKWCIQSRVQQSFITQSVRAAGLTDQFAMEHDDLFFCQLLHFASTSYACLFFAINRLDIDITSSSEANCSFSACPNSTMR